LLEVSKVISATEIRRSEPAEARKADTIYTREKSS
jgi:hypothetical protein